MRKLLLALLFALPTLAAQYPTTSFTAGGNITSANASCLGTNCVPIKLPGNAASLTVNATGTFSATLKVEESNDGGFTWVSAGTDITSVGLTSYTVSALSDFRVRASAYVSGNAGITILASTAPLPAGGGTGSVTSVATTSPITGGTITTTGTIACATCTVTVASGTATLGTSAIGSNACASTVTVTATGVATTDDIMADFNANPTGSLGYEPGAMLTIVKYPTSGNVNFVVCNNTTNSITPAAQTINWRVVR